MLFFIFKVDVENKKIRRNPTKPLPIFDDEMKAECIKRTVYLKGFPKDGSTTLDKLMEHFDKDGPFENIHVSI